MSTAPAVLLATGAFYGTLAAARCFGRAGIPVTMAEGRVLAPARWSRYVTRRVSCPDVEDTEAFLAWLLAFGAASPGHVLLPTSDDLAWLYAENHAALAATFRMVELPLSTVDGLLDKRALAEHCRAVGLGAPDTWYPGSEREAVEVAREAGFPLLLKPRSQVFFASHMKGALVTDAAGLRAQFNAFLSDFRYGERLRRRTPDVVYPMLQRYYAGASEDIYGLSGYADGEGGLVSVLASRKVLQRPRKLGIGLCFEEAAVDPTLVEKLGALTRRVGYRGVFEAELIHAEGGAVLIDWNPRFFSQLAFDVARGSPLPMLAYADATGDAARFAALAEEARVARSAEPQVYCHRFLLEIMLRAQGISRRLSAEDVRRWRRWWALHRGGATDAVADARDPAPWFVDVAAHLAAYARHPRAFVRSMVLDM